MATFSLFFKSLKSRFFYLSAMSIFGILWGMQCFFSSEQQNISSPFNYILGAFILGIFATIILNFYLGYKNKKDYKILLKKILIGSTGWITGFLLASFLTYPLLILGKIFLFFTRLINISDTTFSQVTSIANLEIGSLWPQFFIVILVATYFYSKIFEKKYKTNNLKKILLILSMPFISPIIGNLLPFSWLKITVCFGLIGLLIGLYFEYIFEKQKDEIIYP